MIKKINHYALEGHGGIYDEEAMTALELCARTARKINEIIDSHNENTEAINEMIREQTGLINSAVESFIKSGMFKDEVANIAGHTQEMEKRINARIDNLMELDPEADGSQMIGDLCVSDSGAIYTSPGTAVRTNFKLIKQKIFDPTVKGLGLVGNLGNVSWNGSAATNRAGMIWVKTAPETFRATVPAPYEISLTLWDGVDVTGYRTGINRIYDTGWCSDVTVPANFPYALTIRTQGDEAISVDEFMVVDITRPRYKADNYPVDLAQLLEGSVHCESWGAHGGYHTNKYTRMATQLFTVNKALRVSIPDHQPYRFAVHTWKKVNGGIPNLFTENDDHEIPTGYFVRDSGWQKSATLEPGGWYVLYFSTEETITYPMPLAVFDALALEWVEEGSVETSVPAMDFGVRGIAHRGLSAYAPENTLLSIKEARRRGFKYVEFDVRFTSDYVPVLLHNESIDSTSNGTGKIADLTLEEVRQYDFGGWFSPQYVGTKIPTLEEALMLCRNIGLIPYIEIKDIPTLNTEFCADKIVDAIRDCGFSRTAVVCSFNKSYIETIAARGHSGCVGIITTYIDGDTTNIDAWVDSIIVITSSYTQEELNYVPSHIGVHVFTVDDENTIMELPGRVTGVISNTLHAGKVLYDNSVL